jgi:type IV pilus assembly protein PilW
VISLQKKNSRILARQSGVSMVELLVAMLLGLFLLFALVQILINGKESFNSANNMSRLQENGRIATNLIITDLKRAGYMGGNSDVPNIFGTTGAEAPAISCDTTNSKWARMITQPIVGLNDTREGFDCIAEGTYLRGDVIAMRYAAPWMVTGALTGTRVYLRSSMFEGRVFVGSEETDDLNVVLDQPQNIRELHAYAYFVGDSGRTCNGAEVPSLFRVRLDDSSQPITEELLPGVDNLQVQYGEADPDDDDKVRYVDAQTVDNWDSVVTTRIWILVRSECAETGFNDDRTYTMGDQEIVPNDNFRRQLYSSVIMVRN